MCQARQAEAQGSRRERVAAFTKAYVHKAPGMVAQKLDWIHEKLKEVDTDIVEHAFTHSLELGDLDKDHLVLYAGLIKNFLAKGKKNPEPSVRGACLHRADSLVPPAPAVATGGGQPGEPPPEPIKYE